MLFSPSSVADSNLSVIFGDVFEFNLDFVDDLWNHQIEVSFNRESGLLSEGSFDKNTNMARAYEAILCL